MLNKIAFTILAIVLTTVAQCQESFKFFTDPNGENQYHPESFDACIHSDTYLEISLEKFRKYDRIKVKGFTREKGFAWDNGAYVSVLPNSKINKGKKVIYINVRPSGGSVIPSPGGGSFMCNHFEEWLKKEGKLKIIGEYVSGEEEYWEGSTLKKRPTYEEADVIAESHIYSFHISGEKLKEFEHSKLVKEATSKLKDQKKSISEKYSGVVLAKYNIVYNQLIEEEKFDTLLKIGEVLIDKSFEKNELKAFSKELKSVESENTNDEINKLVELFLNIKP